jgi:hypothetical protein
LGREKSRTFRKGIGKRYHLSNGSLVTVSVHFAVDPTQLRRALPFSRCHFPPTKHLFGETRGDHQKILFFPSHKKCSDGWRDLNRTAAATADHVKEGFIHGNSTAGHKGTEIAPRRRFPFVSYSMLLLMCQYGLFFSKVNSSAVLLV